jgi:transposase InsO family protein
MEGRLIPVQANHPFERIHIDLIGPMANSRGYIHILTIVDAFSKWIEAIPLTNKRASTVAWAVVTEWVTRYGFPDSIHSDQGTEFENQLLRDICAWAGVDKTRTTPYHPECNGQAERLNRAIKETVTAICMQHGSHWYDALPFAVWSIRSAVNRSTQFAPYTILFGRPMRMPYDYQTHNDDSCALYHEWVENIVSRMEAIQRIVNKNLLNAQMAMERSENVYRHTERCFMVGDKVLVRMLHRNAEEAHEKFIPRWRGPAVIVEVLNDVAYRVRFLDGNEQVYNIKNLKRYLGTGGQLTTDASPADDDQTSTQIQDGRGKKSTFRTPDFHMELRPLRKRSYIVSVGRRVGVNEPESRSAVSALVPALRYTSLLSAVALVDTECESELTELLAEPVYISEVNLYNSLRSVAVELELEFKRLKRKNTSQYWVRNQVRAIHVFSFSNVHVPLLDVIAAPFDCPQPDRRSTMESKVQGTMSRPKGREEKPSGPVSTADNDATTIPKWPVERSRV